MSSTHAPRCGSSSLTQRPLAPRRCNANGGFNTLPGSLVGASTSDPAPGSNRCPARRSSSGL